MKYLFSLLLCGLALWSGAQQNPSVFTFQNALSFNPTVLLATDNTAMLGAERRLKNKIALVLDAGYIFGTYYLAGEQPKGTSGFSIRPGVKLYNKSYKGFFQFQVAYKQVDYKMEGWLGKACVAGVPTYEQFQEFTYRKKALSFNVLAGELFRLSDAILLELYAGLGVKIKNQKPTEKNACFRSPGEGFLFNPLQENSVTANVPLGVKVVVPIR